MSLKAQTYEWASAIGGSEEDRGQSITTDASGNVYTTGFFTGTVDFDPSPNAVRDLTSNGFRDVFVQKLDPSGNLVWAVAFGGSSNDEGRSIQVDASGNVIVTGYFFGTADFDPGPFTSSLTSTGGRDVFVQKLDSNGLFLWAKTSGGSNDDEGRSVALDASGNIYTAGYFFGTGDFDPGSGTLNLNAAGGRDAFVQKLDASGNLVWALAYGGSSNEEVRSIGVDATGDIYTAGSFSGTADFDPDTGTVYLNTTGNNDAYVQKLNASGEFLWAKAFGGTSNDFIYAMDMDASGNVYTCGSFQATADFDPNSGTANLTSQGGYDIFVHKLNASGNYEWVRALNGNLSNEAYSLSVDGAGNVFTTGSFRGAVDFDPDSTVFELSSNGGGAGDVFVQKMNTSGVFQWARAFGGNDQDAGGSITTDLTGNIYTTGYFSDAGDFDPDTSSAVLISAGGLDAFVHKLGSCQPTSGTATHVACGSFTWIDGMTYTASNSTATYSLLNAGGCDSLVTLNLTINNVSDISTTVDGQMITANNASATYQWLACENGYSIITGETGQSFTPTSSGVFAVELTENGCVDTSECVTINSVGVWEKPIHESVKLFPNPTNGDFNISVTEAFKHTSVRILDLTGKQIQVYKIDDSQFTTLQTNLNSGLYHVEIISSEEQVILPLIIQN